MSSYFWTPEERERLLAMRAEGMASKECAEVLGRSYKSVTNYIERHRLPRRYYKARTPQPVEYVQEEVIASEALREATLAALERFANDNRVTPQDARAILLGREPQRNVPRMYISTADRTGHTPFEVRR